MGKIVVVANQKGGCGKSTSAIHIAAGLQEQGADVILIDADPQQSTMKWRAASAGKSPFNVVSIPNPILHQEGPSLAGKYDYVVIDCPHGKDVAITRSALAVAHLTLIPVNPSPFDIWSGDEIVPVIKRAQEINPGLLARVLITRKIPNTSLGRESHAAMGQFPFPVIRTAICQRVAFIECLVAGMSVLQYDPSGEAAKECRDLVKEIAATISDQNTVSPAVEAEVLHA